VEQVLEERALSRRGFLAAAAAGLGLTACDTAEPLLEVSPQWARGVDSEQRVAVVGAGLAGLTAAYRLRQAGVRATVYEASTRLGGRCWTLRGAFAQGQLAEHGGELIDQSHKHIRQLAQELGLRLDNVLAAQANGTEPCYFFDGSTYGFREATADIKAIWQPLHRDVSEASYPTLYNSFTARGAQLDQLSVAQWIEQTVAGGRASLLGQLLEVAYIIEYGEEATAQSALNLLYLLGYSGQGQLRIFGPSNEKYHVRGGNDQLVARLADRLGGQIETGAALVAIRRTAAGAYELGFDGRSPLVADRLILALPVAVLRDTVDYADAGFQPLKQTAISELGMSANCKLNVQFGGRFWERLGCSGDSFADTGYQATWDVTRAQPGSAGILVNYTGGDVARAQAGGSAAALAARFLAQVEPVLPGATAAATGVAHFDDWQVNPWSRGAYSYWRVGQYTRFAGVEREREGNCHFAGEHTSVDFQGYLNGAVESGERAAAEVLAELYVNGRG
jgi:monoamine oxidase